MLYLPWFCSKTFTCHFTLFSFGWSSIRSSAESMKSFGRDPRKTKIQIVLQRIANLHQNDRVSTKWSYRTHIMLRPRVLEQFLSTFISLLIVSDLPRRIRFFMRITISRSSKVTLSHLKSFEITPGRSRHSKSVRNTTSRFRHHNYTLKISLTVFTAGI